MSPAAPLRTRPVAIDLFSGAGGLSLGFEMAGFDIVSAVEYDPVHAATHLFNFPLTDVLCRDVSRIGKNDLLASAERGWRLHNPDGRVWDRKVDVIIGGPSCQGFSSMGYRNADDERNLLVGEFARLVEEIRPRAFVMENVPGILSSQYSRILDTTLVRLRRAGYVIADHQVPLNASDFGVPQRRKRVVFFGLLDGVKAPELPVPTESRQTTVAEALFGLPELTGRVAADGELLELTDDQYQKYITARNDYLGILQCQSDGQLSHPRHSRERVLSGYRITEHRAASIARFRDVPQGKVEPVSRAWRLSEGAPSRTLRAGTGRERGAFSASRPLHPSEPRVITIREAARLHSFPDWFRFHTTNWHGHRQIGNAVPPLLAKAVGTAVLESLGFERRTLSLNAPAPAPEALLNLSPTSAAAYLSAETEETPRARRRPQSIRQPVPVRAS